MTGFMDLEFGQVYGSYRRDFVPTEAGLLVHRSDDDNIAVRGRKFEFDGYLVMRQNSLDSLGNPIALEETVINPNNMERIPYDPKFRIDRKTRGEMEGKVHSIFRDFGKFIGQMMKEHELDRIIFFGGQEDLNLLRKGKASMNRILTQDLQKEIRTELGHDLSLDKASMMIDYGSNGREIFSKHYRYHVPEKFTHLLDPHKAVGDSARIFLLNKEYNNHRKEFIKTARRHLKKIQRYRELDEEVPIF